MKIALRLNVDYPKSQTRAVSEMSRGMQRVYNRTLRRFSANQNVDDFATKIVPKLHARVCVNGHEFEGLEAMPPEYRRFYEDILVRVLPVQRAVDIVARAERCNFITRMVTLGFIAVGCLAAIVYLWTRGYYG